MDLTLLFEKILWPWQKDKICSNWFGLPCCAAVARAAVVSGFDCSCFYIGMRLFFLLHRNCLVAWFILANLASVLEFGNAALI